jgi:hypothetical protein
MPSRHGLSPKELGTAAAAAAPAAPTETALCAEAERLYEALRRNRHASSSPFRAHALVKGRRDALVIERVLELARSHGYQVDVEPLRGAGELLVLAPSRRLDQPD